VTIGSIEGDGGNVFLGANNLTVGSNNLSTTFSGVIQDGGQNGGTGGSLTKIGTGTLILSGANTYTGDSTVNRGVLQVDGSITSNTVVNRQGTLSGMGTSHGSLTNQGTVSPGSPTGTLTVANFTQAKSPT
jgi:autotransporter-associated beta strand protein